MKSRIGRHESKSEPGFIGVVLRMFVGVMGHFLKTLNVCLNV